MRCHNRGDRRHVDDMATLRKVRIVHMLNNYWVYPAFGYYRKGKSIAAALFAQGKQTEIPSSPRAR